MSSPSTPEIVTIVGARPQFIKAAVVSRALAEVGQVRERLVHTGQHYDATMSEVFFEELGLPKPDCNLGVGPAGHGAQTGRMLAAVEEVLLEWRPRAVVVYGDTNSTLAGALAAAKLGIPLAHVEAGLRSFERTMPEEINRVLTDRVADLLLCPTTQAVEHLAAEGITRNVHQVGDVMFDAVRLFGEVAARRVDPLGKLGLKPGEYVLMTCHRAGNTDDADRLGQILKAAETIARSVPVVFPVHPRTRARLTGWPLLDAKGLHIIPPVSYFETLCLEREAAVIVTDSGGMQKEAFIWGVPCVTMREETEWTETVDVGANCLASAQADRIVQAVADHRSRTDPLPDAAPYYGHGQAASRTAALIGQLASI
ncbi:MAG: UDP-N-acetylglucosamine 2-epimerase (non-hydrolyzing) [Pirellulales bacterium]|nr:UDP-N-acetylglucosamine 2-epimerase (non-hydrolyzing) [Pirellulales bacterium]